MLNITLFQMFCQLFCQDLADKSYCSIRSRNMKYFKQFVELSSYFSYGFPIDLLQVQQKLKNNYCFMVESDLKTSPFCLKNNDNRNV